MQIVITDGFTLNPGDLSWDAIHKLGTVKYYDRTPPELVKERCREASVIITNKTPVSSETIRVCPELRLIAVTATGYNIVDVKAAKEAGVVVCNVPEYGTYSVAQHAFALLLALSNKVGENAASVNRGDWSKSADWSYSIGPIVELLDKTMGIVGFGKIGQQTGRLARAFGMKVIYFNPAEKGVDWAEAVSLEELFRLSDFVSLHCPLTLQNNQFINKKLLNTMNASAFLINTSRGQLINEVDLAEALKGGKLAGAALDVLSAEPPPADHPLIGLKNCLITPHNAWLSFEARKRILETTLENIRCAIDGKPVNVVGA